MKDLNPQEKEALTIFLSHVNSEGWQEATTPMNQQTKLSPEGAPCFKVDVTLPFHKTLILPFFNDLEAVHRHDAQID